MSTARMRSRMTDAPDDRLTRLANIAAEAVMASDEYDENDKLLICLDRDDEDHDHLAGGMMASGYSGHGDIFVSLIEHAKSVIESTGRGTVELIRDDGSETGYFMRLVFSDHGKLVAAQMAAAFLKDPS